MRRIYKILLLVAIIGLVAISSARAALSDDLIAYYGLDESGIPLADFTGTENLSVLDSGAPDYGNANAIINNSINLTASIVQTTSATPTNQFGTGDFAVSAWIDITGPNGAYLNILGTDSYSGGGTYVGWYLQRTNGNLISFNIRNSSTFEDYPAGTTTVNAAGGWYHIVGQRVNGTYIQIFVNGVEDKLHTLSGLADISNTVPLHIGQSDETTGNRYAGYIDELAIWDRALTAEEVGQLYNGGAGNSYYNITATPSNVTNVTFQVSSDQIVSPAYNVTLTNGTTTHTYNNRTGTVTTDILDNTTSLWNITVNSNNHFIYTDNNVNLSGGAYTANITATDSTITAQYSSTTTPVTIGTAYATVDSFTYTPLADSPGFAIAQIELNSTTASTAECRVLINGTDYNSATTRTLSSNSVGNLFISTNDFNLTGGANTSVEVECRKSGGGNYIVDNAATIIHSFHDQNNGINVTHQHINASGVSVNTTWQPIYTWNFTTGDYNLSNNDNLHWLFLYRSTVTYTATTNLSLQIAINGDFTTCQNISRYGTAGSSGSFGNACLSGNLASNTTYNATVYANTGTGGALLDDAVAHTWESLFPIGAHNSTIQTGATFNSTYTAVHNVSITNPIGGSYQVVVMGSINAQANQTTTGRFYINNSALSTNTLIRSLQAAGNGNVVLFGIFNETGTGTRNYTLYANCDATCTIGITQLAAYIVDQQNVTTGQFPVYAHDAYNGSTLLTFNVTTQNATRSTTNGSINIPTIDPLQNITIAAQNYFSNTTEADTTTTINASLVPWTAIYAVTASNSSRVSIYNVTYNGTNYSSNPATNTSYIPLYNETSEVQLWTTEYAVAIANITATGYLRNYTFTLYTRDTFNITFYNETTDQPWNITVYYSIISSSEARNGSTNSSNATITLLTPDQYEIIYYSDPNVQRSYYVTLTNYSYTNLRLYLITDAESDIYLPTVTDEDDQACANMNVSLLRYYVDINGYRVVEMSQTDTNGQAVFHVQPNEINYKLLFSGACGTFTSQPQKITSSTDGFTVTGAQGLLTSAEALQNADISFTYNNATQTYVFTWSDSESVVTQGCIYIYRKASGQTTTNYSACSDGATGSLIYTLTGNLTDTEWSAQGVLTTNTEYSTYTYRGPDLSFLTSIDNWGVAGVFWSLILLLGIVLATSQSAGAVVFSTIGTIAVLITLGVVSGGGSVLVGLLIVGVVLLYKIRTS